MSTVHVKSSNKEIIYKSGQNLMTTLLKAGIFVDNPCNGKGTCGKCKVKIYKGQIKEVCETEKQFLSKEELRSGIRLSCFLYPESDIELDVLQSENNHRILTSGLKTSVAFKPWDYKGFGIEVNIDKRSYGIAIDIGTTTVVAALIDLRTASEIKTASMINPQKHYGLDVLTRITYAMENPGTAQDDLQSAIVKGINELINQLLKATSVRKEELHDIVVAGNTTMLHLLLGVDSSVIGRAPYKPNFIESKCLFAKDIGIEAGRETMLYCLPSLSAYIGADIVAGVYACELHKKEKTTLFIDIGTNGEIALAHEGRLLSCSCAAGPALEGMNISSGMRAQDGAIEEISISEEGIKTQVIGNTEGIGLCGSGILAVLRELLKTGIVTKKGAMIKLDTIDEMDYRRQYIELEGKKRTFVIPGQENNLKVTQSDVRQVQLAKGAILSGFYALLNAVGITMDHLDEVIVAGQFGAHLSADSLIGTGILPEAVKDKLVYIGNASKTGAYMALMSGDVRREMEELSQRMSYMELSNLEGYERLFSKCLLFE